MATKKTKTTLPSSIEFQGTIPRLSLTMPIDAKKAKAIQSCIEKGQLKITVNKVDLKTGRIGDAWLYD